MSPCSAMAPISSSRSADAGTDADLESVHLVHEPDRTNGVRHDGLGRGHHCLEDHRRHAQRDDWHFGQQHVRRRPSRRHRDRSVGPGTRHDQQLGQLQPARQRREPHPHRLLRRQRHREFACERHHGQPRQQRVARARGHRPQCGHARRRRRRRHLLRRGHDRRARECGHRYRVRQLRLRPAGQRRKPVGRFADPEPADPPHRQHARQRDHRSIELDASRTRTSTTAALAPTS